MQAKTVFCKIRVLNSLLESGMQVNRVTFSK